MHPVSPWFFGPVTFGEGEEWLRFQYRFLCVLLLASAAITAIFHLLATAGLSQFDPRYLLCSRAYLLLTVLHYALLRNRPQRLPALALSFLLVSSALHAATFLLNTPDEFRLIWFALNLPGAYLILGSRAGAAVTGLSLLFIVLANPYLATPYSPNALVTCALAMLYLSLFFHAFANRSISFHQSMVDANRRLAGMAALDPLTGLLNARGYYSSVEHALSRPGPFAVLFVDLDHFKRINDTLGHAAGDAVLRQVAACLTRHIRATDILGRIGGEEFSILLPGCELDAALRVAETLRAAVERLQPSFEKRAIPVTASLGVATGQAPTPDFAAIQSLADQALYEAKRQGRNRVTPIRQAS